MHVVLFTRNFTGPMTKEAYRSHSLSTVSFLFPYRSHPVPFPFVPSIAILPCLPMAPWQGARDNKETPCILMGDIQGEGNSFCGVLSRGVLVHYKNRHQVTSSYFPSLFPTFSFTVPTPALQDAFQQAVPHRPHGCCSRGRCRRCH